MDGEDRMSHQDELRRRRNEREEGRKRDWRNGMKRTGRAGGQENRKDERAEKSEERRTSGRQTDGQAGETGRPVKEVE